MGTFNGTYTSTVTLSSSQRNTTLGSTGLINAYGPAGTFTIDLNHTLTAETFSAGLFGPSGTIFTITNNGIIETHGSGGSWFDAGIVLGAPGTAVNNGTIEGAAGIFMIGSAGSSGALIENSKLIGGSISAGIFLGTSGTVLNTGSISGPKSGVIFQNSVPAYISNASTGVISSSHGYAIQMYGGTVVNAGLLSGFYGGAALKGTIQSVVNAGTMLSTATAPGSYGAYAALQISQDTASLGAHIFNSVSGHIEGGYGIQINNSGSTASPGTMVNSITNDGIILGSLGSGIVDWAGTLALQNSGTIVSTIGAANSASNNAGVQAGYTGFITNSLGGGISGDWGIKLSSGTVFNDGSISGDTSTSGVSGNYAAIYIQNSGDVFNSLSGHITGASGIRINGSSGNYVENAGFINASKGAGVYFYQGGTVTNTGTITGPHHGIVTGGSDAAAPGIISNAGLIESSSTLFVKDSVTHTGGGIALLGGGFVTNQSGGVIIGANGIYGTASSGGITIENAGHITGTYKSGIVLNSAGYINNSGSIGGSKDGIDLKAGGTVVDSGTISGTNDAIYFGPANSRLVIEAGASIIGGATAAYSNLSTSFLELGSAGAGASFDLGGTVNGFNYIDFDSGQSWSLEGNISELGNGTVDINGFASGDTLILSGFTASSDSFNSGLSVLSLSNGTDVDQLTLFGPYTEFNITDVAAGTEITVQELCYVRGTHILTPTGERLVEDLRAGDEVVARRSGIVRLRWIGYQAYAGRFLARDAKRLPVRILPGALGERIPRRELVVSPGHSLLLGETLVLARDMVNGVTILQDEVAERVEYFGLELEAHDCVIAEGAFAETYADAPGMRNQFHNAADFYARFPDHTEPEGLVLCAPRPESGPDLEAVLRPVAMRAAALVKPGRVRGYVEIMDEGGRVEGWAQDTANPELPVLVEIRAGGIAVGTALAFGYRGDLEAAGIGKGRAMFSFAAPAGAQITVHAADGTALPLSDECRMRLAG